MWSSSRLQPTCGKQLKCTKKISEQPQQTSDTKNGWYHEWTAPYHVTPVNSGLSRLKVLLYYLIISLLQAPYLNYCWTLSMKIQKPCHSCQQTKEANLDSNICNLSLLNKLTYNITLKRLERETIECFIFVRVPPQKKWK